MLNNTSKWSHARGNTVVPSRWQATIAHQPPPEEGRRGEQEQDHSHAGQVSADQRVVSSAHLTGIDTPERANTC